MTRARFQIPNYPRTRPTVPEVLPLIREFYAQPGNEAGGVLHIVLDDGNLARSHIEWCLEQATAAGDLDARTLAILLLRMTPTQRRKCYTRTWRCDTLCA